MAMATLNRIRISYRRLVIVLALNIPLIFAILYFNLKDVRFSALTWVYLFTVTLGYYVLFILIISTIAFILFFYIRKLALAVSIAVIAVAVFFLLIDSFVYQVTKIHIDPFWMNWILHDFSAFGIPASTLRAVALCMLAMIFFEFGMYALAKRLPQRRGITVSFILLLIASFGASQVIHLVAYENNVTYITSMTPGLPIYYPVTSHKNAQKYAGLLPVDDEISTLVSESRKGGLNYPLNEIRLNIDADKPAPNILIILYESWRYDAMTPEVTPNTYNLSAKSTVCLDHYSSGNSTVAGIFGLFYGIHPTYWSAVIAENVLINNPVLIDGLKDRGYSFGIFARSNFERHKIKDAIFRDIDVHESFAGRSLVEQDRDMTRQLLDFLREQKKRSQPFMALAFYKSNHAPYGYPPEDSLFMPAGDQNLILADDNTDPGYYYRDYLNATHYVDRFVGEILDELDLLGDMSNTIIIITTDHAEEFNDDRANYWGHGSNFTQYQTRVPMIIYFPDKEPRRLSWRTSHIDIPPTILQEYLGCTNNIHDYSNGVNLFCTPVENRPLVIGSYVNHAFIIGDNVYEIYPFQTKSYKLYDIDGEASKPPLKDIKKVFAEISCFYKDRDLEFGSHASLMELDDLNP